MKLAIIGVLVLAACVPLAAQVDEPLRRDASALFGQIHASTTAATPEVELGRALFWDTRVSSDGKTACASCHSARDWGADRRRFSPDARGALTSRHSPTIFNSMSQPALRWLGDRKSGADQAESSLTGSLGFKSKDAALATLTGLDYLPAFRAAYPQDPHPLSLGNYARALEAYQATLTTPAPFDRFLAGDDRALTDRQKTGMRTFISTGCAGCHNGANLGGAMFQRFGLVKDYWPETGSEKPAGPLRGHQKRGRPLRVPRSDAAQRGEDRAVLPRRLRRAPRPRGSRHGERAARTHARRCERGRHRFVPRVAHRRSPAELRPARQAAGEVRCGGNHPAFVASGRRIGAPVLLLCHWQQRITCAARNW
jgi:cytochrome c peroxidase